MKDRLMRQEEAAEHLRVSKWTIYRRIKEKRLPVYKIGGLNFFKESELDNYINSFKRN